MYLFRDQFDLDKSDWNKIMRFNKFIIQVYLKYWYECPNAMMAPFNDLQLLKDIIDYEKVDSKISEVAFKKMSNHLWYLSEPLVALAFFDERVSIQDKKYMVKALQKPAPKDMNTRATLQKKEVKEKKISDFVTSNTLKFLQDYEIGTSWLGEDPSSWKKIKITQRDKFFSKVCQWSMTVLKSL